MQINNEEFHYVEPQHKTVFIDTMWDIWQAIRNCKYIETQYKRSKAKQLINNKVKQVAIMFLEYCFYQNAYIDDENMRKDFEVENDPNPTIFCIDRIKSLKCWTRAFTYLSAADLRKASFGRGFSLCTAVNCRRLSLSIAGMMWTLLKLSIILDTFYSNKCHAAKLKLS